MELSEQTWLKVLVPDKLMWKVRERAAREEKSVKDWVIEALAGAVGETYETVVQKGKEQPRTEDEVLGERELDYSATQADENPVLAKAVAPVGLSSSESMRWMREQAQKKLERLRKEKISRE